MRFHLATLSEERYELCEESLPAGAPSVCVGELGIGGYELRIFSSSKATWATGHVKYSIYPEGSEGKGGREGGREGAALKLHSLMPSVSGA